MMYQPWWIILPLLPSLLVIFRALLGSDDLKLPPPPRDSLRGGGWVPTDYYPSPSCGQPIYVGKHRAQL